MTDIDGLRAEAPGMETTAEERSRITRRFGPPHGYIMGDVATAKVAALLRDFDRLSAEVARLSAALAEERAATMERIRENSLRATTRETAARAEERAAILHDAEHIRKLTVKSDTALETIDSFINAIRARGRP